MSEHQQEDKLRQEILGDAKVKAERSLARARNEAEKTIQKATRDAEAKRQARLQEANRDAEEKCRAIRIDIERETRRHWLLKREECLEALFANAVEQASATTGEEHILSMEALASEAIQAIGPRSMTAIFPASDAGLVTLPWLNAIADRLFGSGSGASFALNPKENAPAGISFETSDGLRTFDNTYVSRMKKMKDDLRIVAVE